MVNVVGGGMAMLGLSPAVPSSVEPSGTVKPVAVAFDPLVAPVLVDAVEDTLPDAPELHAVCAVELEFDAPPPSKFDDDTVVPVAEQGTTAGLNPLGFNSVAPKGMSLRSDDEFEGAVPSGEVCPMPGGRLVCARPAPPQAIQMTATKIEIRRIEATVFSRRTCVCT